jgi:hypothetical protein
MMMSHYSTATRPTRKRSLAVKTAATIASPCMAHLPSQVRFPVAEGATVVHEGGLGTGCRGFNRPSSWRDKTRRNACLFARFDPGTSLWYNFSVIVATATTRIRAHSSAAERPAHNRLVLGSNPGGPIAIALETWVVPGLVLFAAAALLKTPLWGIFGRDSMYGKM